jgi:cobalt-zinc-cadmium efflux system membrane fusion protein
VTEAGGPKPNQRLLVVLGIAGLVGLSIAATVAVEHHLHGHDVAAHGHEDHGHAADGPRTRGAGPVNGKHAAEGRIKLGPAALANAKLGIRTAGPGKVAISLSLPGEVALNAEHVAHVTPRVAGSVREVKKQLGDSVKKGDVLAVLESRELAEMQRDFLAAKERLELAETNFKRQEQLWQEKISAEKDYLSAKQALAEAKIEHRAASQKLAAGAGPKSAGGGLVLTAPLDGTIIEKHAVVGEVLSDDRLAFVVADLSTLWVNVTVYAKDLSKVRLGQRAVVRAEGIAEPALGELTYIDRVVGEQTRSAIARIVLTAPKPEWRAGLFVTADVSVEEVEAPVVVSYEAVQRVNGESVVFVQDGDAFVTRKVKTGRQGVAREGARELLIEIVQGVAAGTQYVAENSFLLKAELGKSEAGHEH